MGVEHHISECPGPERSQPEGRRFIPADLYSEDYKDFDPKDFESPFDGFTMVPCPYAPACELCGTVGVHTSAIIVSVDGACRDNGRPAARSAVGVHFGSEARHNIALGTDDQTPTSQRAELIACLAALAKAEIFKQADIIESFNQIVIKADSDYLVKSMTEYVSKWKTNGFRSSTGKPVVNGALIKKIEEKVEKLGKLGVRVFFWHVERGRNQEADSLANAGFMDDISFGSSSSGKCLCKARN